MITLQVGTQWYKEHTLSRSISLKTKSHPSGASPLDSAEFHAMNTPLFHPSKESALRLGALRYCQISISSPMRPPIENVQLLLGKGPGVYITIGNSSTTRKTIRAHLNSIILPGILVAVSSTFPMREHAALPKTDSAYLSLSVCVVSSLRLLI